MLDSQEGCRQRKGKQLQINDGSKEESRREQIAPGSTYCSQSRPSKVDLLEILNACFCICLVSICFLPFVLLSVVIGLVIGGIVRQKGFQGALALFGDLGKEFWSDPVGFYIEVVGGTRSLYIDPFTYLFNYRMRPASKRGAPEPAWWDCSVEADCLTERLATYVPAWASAFKTVQSAVEVIGQPENLMYQGNWSYVMVWEEKKKRCLLGGVTICEDVLRVVEHLGLRDLLQAVKLSQLHPGAQLKVHHGPRYDRFRIMLPIIVPVHGAARKMTGVSQPGADTLGLHVGNTTRELKLAEPLCFNDAVRHTAWNFREGPRLAMLVDLLHPSLSPRPYCSSKGGPGQQRCSAICALLWKLLAAKTAPVGCKTLPWKSHSECIRTCETELSWGPRYMECLKGKCWDVCEKFKDAKPIATGTVTATHDTQERDHNDWTVKLREGMRPILYIIFDFIFGSDWTVGYN